MYIGFSTRFSFEAFFVKEVRFEVKTWIADELTGKFIFHLQKVAQPSMIK